MSDLKFLKSDGGSLVLTERVIENMIHFRQHRNRKPESGGLMLGRHILHSNHLVVDVVTVPQHSDRSTRYQFYRSADHQKIAYKHWLESKNTCTYLGNWHTHPESFPSPSFVDKINWKKAIKKDKYEGSTLYFVIVGIKEISCWEGKRRRWSFKKLNLRE